MFSVSELNPVLSARNWVIALSRLIQRHPILRTSFHIAGFSEPLQLVHRQSHFRLTVEDLREVDSREAGKGVGGMDRNRKARAF